MCRGQQQTHAGFWLTATWVALLALPVCLLAHPQSALEPWSHPSTQPTPQPGAQAPPHLSEHLCMSMYHTFVSAVHPVHLSCTGVLYFIFRPEAFCRGEGEASCVGGGCLKNQSVKKKLYFIFLALGSLGTSHLTYVFCISMFQLFLNRLTETLHGFTFKFPRICKLWVGVHCFKDFIVYFLWLKTISCAPLMRVISDSQPPSPCINQMRGRSDTSSPVLSNLPWIIHRLYFG